MLAQLNKVVLSVLFDQKFYKFAYRMYGIFKEHIKHLLLLSD